MNLILDDCKQFYDLLRHGEDYSDLRCVDVERGGVVNRSIVKGWPSVLKWLRRFNGQGNCFIGRNPRYPDGSVCRVSGFSLDIDGVYPDGTSKLQGAMPELLRNMLAEVQEIRKLLPGSLLGFSGNGFLVYMPLGDFGSSGLGDYQNYLGQMEELFRRKVDRENKGVICVDKTYDNPRMVKFLGTVSCKGVRRNSRILALPRRSFDREAIHEVIQGLIARTSHFGEADGHLAVTGHAGTNGGITLYGQARSHEPLGLIRHGEMHSALLNFAGACRKRGLDSDAIYKQLVVFAEARCEKPIDYKRLEQMSRSMMNYTPEAGIPHENATQAEAALFNLKDSFPQYLSKLDARVSEKNAKLKTGFSRLDHLTHGLSRGDIYTVGAYTGGGKSTWCVNVALSLCKAQRKVLYLSTELSYDRIFDKFAGLATETPLSSFEKGLDNDQRRKVSEIGAVCGSFSVNDAITPNIGVVRSLVGQSTPDVLIFDHIQQVGEGSQKRNETINNFLSQLHGLAREFNFALLVVSQFKRPETYIDFQAKKVVAIKHPTLYDFKECAGIENKSRVAVLLYEKGEAVDAQKPVMIFEVAKCSFGRTGKVEMVFDMEMGRFTEVDNDVHPEGI